jgi:hexokinase
MRFVLSIGQGTYLAVDMGGTNIRVCAVTFNGDGTYSMVQDKVAIPSALMTSNSCMELFDWVAQRVEGFVEKRQVETTSTDHGSARTQSKVSFDLGFTFSHAVQQKSINSGTLIRWSKGFDIDGVVGRDVCTLLQEAFDRHALPVRVTALTNDTVGTLLSQAYGAPPRSRTLLGAVFGTGTNGAYVEKASKITKDESLATSSEKMMIVNTEWGNFDQRLEFLSTTTYDRIIDASSVNPGFEMFEKQISGMYLGELLRLAVLSLSPDHSPGIFIEMNIPKNSGLYVPWSLDTSFLSHLESDTSPELSTSRLHIEQWLGSAHVSYDVASTIKRIARAIVRRSARLSAVALGAVLVQTGCLAKDVEGDKTCIGVDGSLIELYPGFIAEIRQALKSIEQIGERGEARVDITIAKNGSGVGAALAAHIAAKHLLS